GHLISAPLDCPPLYSPLFVFHTPPTPQAYTLSLHDALPICRRGETGGGRTGRRPHLPSRERPRRWHPARKCAVPVRLPWLLRPRSEEHTSELQSLAYLVCRLLLEKKKLHLDRRVQVEQQRHQ